MRTPTVSIIVPTYNRAGLLPRALDSILAQTCADWEIVLVDDGSTDETPETAARYARRVGERFVYLRQRNGGSSRARNTGIDASRGRFLAFLDSDDEFLPRKLERQLAFFDARPQLGFVYSDCAFVDLDGVRHDSAFDEKLPMARRVPFQAIAPGFRVVNGDLFDWLIREYFLPTIVGLVRRAVIDRGLRFPEGRAYAEEWLFYLQIARVCRAGFVDEPLSLHHHTPGSLSRTDKHGNALHYYETLRAVECTFPDLSPAQLRTVRVNLANAARQLGYDAVRASDSPAARRWFSAAFRHQPNPRSAKELVAATARALLHGRRSSVASQVQDAS